jgi:hypothetical protein
VTQVTPGHHASLQLRLWLALLLGLVAALLLLLLLLVVVVVVVRQLATPSVALLLLLLLLLVVLLVVLLAAPAPAQLLSCQPGWQQPARPLCARCAPSL